MFEKLGSTFDLGRDGLEKLRENCRNHPVLISRLTGFMVPSYGQKQKSSREKVAIFNVNENI